MSKDILPIDDNNNDKNINNDKEINKATNINSILDKPNNDKMNIISKNIISLY